MLSKAAPRMFGGPSNVSGGNMLYVKPEIVASYNTGTIIGTTVGFASSSCVNSDPNNMCDHG